MIAQLGSPPSGLFDNVLWRPGTKSFVVEACLCCCELLL